MLSKWEDGFRTCGAEKIDLIISNGMGLYTACQTSTDANIWARRIRFCLTDASGWILLIPLNPTYLYCWADLIDNTEQILPIPFAGSYWLCWADVIDPSERILLIPLSGTYLSDVRIIPSPLRGSYWLCWGIVPILQSGTYLYPLKGPLHSRWGPIDSLWS